MRSSEQQADADTATAPAVDGAPRATRPRSTIGAKRLFPEPTQRELTDEALRRADETRTAMLCALGRDVDSTAAGHLRQAFSALDDARRHLASGRALAR